jgi:hypothetical protein
MTIEPFAAIIVPLVTAVLGGLVSLLVAHRTMKPQEQANLMDGYSQLCDDLRAMISLNNEEIARLRGELVDLRCRFEQDQASWRREREALLARIAELEAINGRLEGKINALQSQSDGKEC